MFSRFYNFSGGGYYKGDCVEVMFYSFNHAPKATGHIQSQTKPRVSPKVKFFVIFQKNII